jgi:hypothetical protein
MMYREFLVPTDEQLLATLGVEPQSGLESGVRHLALVSGDGYDVTATTDVLGRSVTVEIGRDNEQLLTITREGAARMSVSENPPEIVFRFDSDETTGRLEIQLQPRLSVRDATLLT